MQSNLTRRGFLGGTVSLAAAPAVRPNILFLMPDQLRAQSVGCYGNPDVHTPHIDRLASESLVFENAFANSPVCCPARAVILTGRYAHANGMLANDLRLRESETSLAEVLQQAGYRTGFVGKWHLDGGPRLPGYVPPGPRRQGFEFWAANQCSHRHFKNHYFRDSPDPLPVRGFEPEGWTDLGIEFLRESRKDGRPFFLTIQMGPPHDPYKAPAEYRQLYDPAKLRMRPNWRQAAGVPGPQEVAEYYAMTTAVDDQVGRLMRTLDEFGMARNTIVLFSSDHGDLLGSHGLRLKRKPWEESIHVPCILRYPAGAGPGRHTDAFFTHVDFAPTLLGLCGLKSPGGIQGADLSPLIRGQRQTPPDSAFFQIFGPYQGDGTADGWRGIRTERHMYARFRSRAWVLFDLKEDPYQMKNLVDRAEAKSLIGQLERRLAAWMRHTGDSWDYNWQALVEDNGRLYRSQTFYSVEDYLRWAKEHTEAQR